MKMIYKINTVVIIRLSIHYSRFDDKQCIFFDKWVEFEEVSGINVYIILYSFA